MPADDTVVDTSVADDKLTSPPNDRRDVDTVVGELVTRYGTERAALRVLADQQLDYRRKMGELRARLPKDGEVVIPKAAADTLEAFKALGKSPADITTALTEREAFSLENAGMRAQQSALEAATLAGYKPSVLQKLARTEGFRIEVKEEGEGDEKKRVAYAVKGDGDKATSTPLGEFVDSTLADFKPALVVAQATQPATSGTPYFAQSAGGTPAAKPDVVAAHTKATYLRPSQRNGTAGAPARP